MYFSNIYLISKLILIILFENCRSDEIFDVTKYGADFKGINKSSEAIREAIDAAVKNGGGTVYFPKGQYLSGPIVLKSNITLHLEDNAIIKFSDDFDDYLPMVRIRWEGTELKSFSPLIYAEGVHNIVIKGHGILDGQGKHWWEYWKQLVNEFDKSGARDSKYQKEFFRVNNYTELKTLFDVGARAHLGFLRPPFIQPLDSKNILIKDVLIRNSPFWNINPVYCENVTITGVRIEAPYPSPNTDGIDPDSCKDFLISNVIFDVGDDCIAIKSGRDIQGRRIGRPTENVVITNCTMNRGISGVAVGSEQSGGVRNVSVTNCLFNGTDQGLLIKATRDRGGVVEDIKISDIHMIDIKSVGVLIELYDHMYKVLNSTKSEPFSESTPVFKNFEFKRLSGNALKSVKIIGLPESSIKNITLSDVNIVANDGLTAMNVENLQMKNYSHTSLKNQTI